MLSYLRTVKDTTDLSQILLELARQISDQIRFQYFYLWWLIGLGMILLVIYLSLTSDPVKVNIDLLYIDKLEHLLAYSVLMGWFSQIYTAAKSRIFWAVIFILMGVTLEFIQDWGGDRFFEYTDMLANTLGVLLGWWLSSKIMVGWLLRIDRAFSA